MTQHFPLEPTNQKNELEEFLMLYHDAQGGLRVFGEDYEEFVAGLHRRMIPKSQVREAIERLKMDEGDGWEMLSTMEHCCPGDDTADIYNAALTALSEELGMEEHENKNMS